MYTCSKVYSDIPFAHRQHLHDGHCKLIHGHNWSIKFIFACSELDANGFVVDFGKLGFIRQWLMDNLDHACVFNVSDPEREKLVAAFGPLFKAYIVDCCSCEGLAKHLYDVMNPMVQEFSDGRAWVAAVEIEEDSKNAATYTA